MAETFGQALRHFRRRAGLSVSELAEELGASRHSIACWERDRRVPRDRARLLDLVEALGLSADEAEQLTVAARLHRSQQDTLNTTSTAPAPVDTPPCTILSHLPRRHQLRAPVADFIGRTDEITRIVAVHQAMRAGVGVTTISGVRGMGGIGKTELAYVIANHLRDAFPDAQIVLNLQGSSAVPLTAAQAVQAVIHAFTSHAQVPDDLPTLEQCYRTLLHDQRVLILADDAYNAAHVQSLIPPAGSVLLVTSRRRFTLPGMITIDLEQLSETDAVALLCQLCPRLHLLEAQTLAQLCGYLPLALRVSGSILQTNPALIAGDYLKLLTDARHRLALLRDPEDVQLDVEASLATSYLQLQPLAQQVFRQLGVFATDFTIELVQPVIAVPAGSDASGMLTRLLQCHLIQYDEERRRWRLHDLVRDLAWHYLEDAGEVDGIMWRYAEAVVEIAQTIQAQYLEGGDEMLTALARFDAERPHLDAGRRWADLHAATPDGDRLLLALTLATLMIGELRADVERERIPQLERALSAAQRLGQRSAEGRLLLSLGRARFDLGKFREAIATWERALEIAQKLEDRHSEGLTLGNLGTAYARLDDPLRAIAAFEQARVLFEAVGDQRHTAHAVGNLGAAYADLKKTPAAIPYLEDALAHARAEGDRRFESMLLHALGEVACGVGEFQRACSAYADALTIARDIGDRQQEGYILMTLGCACAAGGDRLGASTTFDQSLTILQDVRDAWGTATCRWHYGLLLADQGNLDDALPLLRASIAYLGDIRHPQADARKAQLARLEVKEPPPPAFRAATVARSVGGKAKTTGHPAADG